MEIMSYHFQDIFLTLRRLRVCNKLNFDYFVIKSGFHRLWLIYILLFIFNRDGCKEFFNKLHAKEIPVLIFSAGVGDVIREIIAQNSTTLYDNMHIVSNDIDFNDEVIHIVLSQYESKSQFTPTKQSIGYFVCFLQEIIQEIMLSTLFSELFPEESKQIAY